MSRLPRPLADALPRLKADLAPATVLADVQTAWQQAAGAQVALHCAPVSEKGGVLTVRCDSGVWAAELSMMSRGPRGEPQPVPSRGPAGARYPVRGGRLMRASEGV